MESVGTKAGYAALCTDKSAAIANSSRAMTRQEAAACTKARRVPTEIRVGADAVALVVSSQNDFAQDLTQTEIQQLFTVARTWSDVRPEWPDEPINRYIPTIDSGTLDFFVERSLCRRVPAGRVARLNIGGAARRQCLYGARPCARSGIALCRAHPGRDV